MTMHTAIVTHPSAWYGRALKSDPSWLIHLTPPDLAEIAEAVARVRTAGLALAEVGRSSFALPTLAAKLEAMSQEILDGRGFVVVRGLDAQSYTDDDVGLIFWGLGAYLGSPVTQNPRGDLLGHVYDHGRRYGELDVRGYETKAHLPFHSDGCDLVGLLCLRRSKTGGLSSIVSSVTLHNEILRQHPEYLEPLYRGFHYIRREAALGTEPVTPHRIPVFGARDGLISARLIRNQINAASTATGRPLDPLERDALDFLDSLAHDPDVHLDMDLQVGDMQLINNYTVLHSRTEFEDFPEPERRRHMIRLWLTTSPRRPLADGFPPQNGYGRNQITEVALQPA
jgi:hypothetical protein